MEKAKKSPEKRERIIRAAKQAFSSQGFYRTRISDIAKAANVADGTVYVYFEGKEQLLSSIFEESMSRFLDAGRRELDGMEGALPRLRRVLELHLESLGSDPELATIFQIELRHSARFMGAYSRSRLRDYFRMIEELLEEGQREGIFRRDLDLWFTTKLVFGLLDETATNWVLSERNYRLSSRLDEVMDFLMHGIQSIPS
ncbi:MAG: TetR/AcrR family transcriptional regulator [Candidatus Krumholzibacteria bacterium]|jgi:TetR/AcrR family fatty acid metabolism transcriptional regulator|nr:TetR/AcrR family transcriptional regulator [Candidatus Krumholzibacteria bacterium]